MAERSGWWFCGGLLAVVAVAAGLRLYALGDEDLWLDELHSLANSAGRRAEFEAIQHGVVLESVPRSTDLTKGSTWPVVLRRMESDTHPPTYFLLLLIWRRVWGDGETALRALSTVFSILSILPVALMFREYGRPRAGLWAAGLTAVAFAHIYIAQETRPYSLALVFVSVSYWALVRMEVGWTGYDRRRRVAWSAVYGLSVYLSVLTHYFAGLALAGQVVFALAKLRGPLLRAWLTIVVVAASGLVLTWGRQFYGQLDLILDQGWLRDQQPNHVLCTLLRLTDLPVRLLFAHEWYQLTYLFSLVGTVLLVGGLVLLWRHRRAEGAVFVAWYLTPVVGYAVIDLVTGKQLLSHLRYLSVATPGLVGLLVLAAAGLRRRARVVAITGCVFAVGLTLHLPTPSNPSNRVAARLISDQLEEGDLLVFDAVDWPPSWTARLHHNVSYYLPAYLDGPNPPCVLVREPPDEALKRDMAAYERIIVVSPRLEVIPNPLPDRFRLANQTPYVRHVGFIYLFVRDAKPGTSPDAK